MGLLSKDVTIKWNPKNLKWYTSKGYTFTKWKDEFRVNVEHLSSGSDVLVEVECNECSETLRVTWNSYLKCVHEDANYFCNKCANNLYAFQNGNATRLKNSTSFSTWCTQNNRLDMLKRWDNLNNTCSPNDLTYSSASKRLFVCPEGCHKSELKRISDITKCGILADCIQCSSFAKWGIENVDKKFLEKYWHWEKNGSIDPWTLRYQSHKKVWIKCQVKSCLRVYNATCANIVNDSGCPSCNFSRGEKSTEHFLIDNIIEFIPQKTFGDLIGTGRRHLSYDFYLPKQNTLIEYQGEQHDRPIDFNGMGKSNSIKQFQKQQEHDERKREYAKINNIKLLEIWYYDFDNIQEILSRELNLIEVTKNEAV